MVLDNLVPLDHEIGRRLWRPEDEMFFDGCDDALNRPIELFVRNDAVAFPVDVWKFQQIEIDSGRDRSAVNRERGLALRKVVSRGTRAQQDNQEQRLPICFYGGLSYTAMYFNGLPQSTRKRSKSAKVTTIVMVLSFG